MGPTNMVSRAIWLITPAVVIGLPYLGILCAWTTTQMPRGSCCPPPSGRLEKTTGSSLHHMAQHHPTGSETSPSYAPRSSRFGSEPPSVEDEVDVWRYAIVSCMPEMTTIVIVHSRLSYCHWFAEILELFVA